MLIKITTTLNDIKCKKQRVRTKKKRIQFHIFSSCNLSKKREKGEEREIEGEKEIQFQVITARNWTELNGIF